MMIASAAHAVVVATMTHFTNLCNLKNNFDQFFFRATLICDGIVSQVLMWEHNLGEVRNCACFYYSRIWILCFEIRCTVTEYNCRRNWALRSSSSSSYFYAVFHWHFGGSVWHCVHNAWWSVLWGIKLVV